jgi:hypothetical protein
VGGQIVNISGCESQRPTRRIMDELDRKNI